ncbi:MAG: Spore protein SP21 [Syntrophus sp. SKADARSKE-3]|nr:Spore protein SP21 [Syntrophus sp. SKADARSKE-3]
MAIRDFLPSVWKKGDLISNRTEDHPLYSLQKEMNSIFDNFFRGFDPIFLGREYDGFGNFSPSIDVKENNNDVIIKVELPGMDEKDVDVSLTQNILTVKGEKKEEKEDKNKDFYRMERRYGSFSRSIPLPTGIKSEKAEAVFKKGVLTITVPKSDEAKSKVKKIEVKTQ